MKKLVEVTEVDGEGLDKLLGENVLLMCANYFYAGKLIGVNEDFVLLGEPSIVYETGAWSVTNYADAQRMHVSEWYVRRDAVESYGLGK